MKEFKGKVVSAKMAKTATVLVVRQKIHPLYKKRIRVGKKYHVHDDLGVKKGDQVKFVETRPISKTKRWKIVEVDKK
ncbi:30S ribosomal protein S17 [Candidatus Shapirobacteria bacterium CG10_big_fil_rev_8_21_14_0_10_40_9]|uniref:Small ribosomal subunit protein uS17 n=1 Tax=Candidatus Shapirobacteria bacterium CG10_big_fil_rev_8_21_14_0_10_40_9 TaxID=1974888 RepID=A0A2M8L383_9BACT|nr:MAG: 30S ribosomal protein S17 [Candidatus Shapirobacteria bacterium CG10_big_fil_rev_8_21_14_0_10_40_9]